MKTVITYGTFDLLHEGHLNLLKRAKKLGDYLIVGVTTENYDKNRGKLNVKQTTIERIENVKKTKIADKIIVEEYEGQKIDDIKKYKVDCFAIGSDWNGKFDYLNEYCSVKYLERTKGISSTLIRNQSISIINIGVIGTGRIATRFIKESKFVSGINVNGVYNPNLKHAKEFYLENELEFYSNDFTKFISKVDAVYIASPHNTHEIYIEKCINNNKHVLSEKPLMLSLRNFDKYFDLAEKKRLVLMEAIKTAYSPAFKMLVSIVKSGVIGQIKDIDATFTKIIEGNYRELKKSENGGSITELVTYPLIAIFKLLGTEYNDIYYYSYSNNEVDLYTKGVICYENAVSTFKVGLGVKSEGNLVISGTKGYVYVPAPWWKTEYFEIRYEDSNLNKKYFMKFEGDGLRYEILEFVSKINNNSDYDKVTKNEMKAIVKVIELYIKGYNITNIK